LTCQMLKTWNVKTKEGAVTVEDLEEILMPFFDEDEALTIAGCVIDCAVQGRNAELEFAELAPLFGDQMTLMTFRQQVATRTQKAKLDYKAESEIRQSATVRKRNPEHSAEAERESHQKLQERVDQLEQALASAPRSPQNRLQNTFAPVVCKIQDSQFEMQDKIKNLEYQLTALADEDQVRRSSRQGSKESTGQPDDGSRPKRKGNKQNSQPVLATPAVATVTATTEMHSQDKIDALEQQVIALASKFEDMQIAMAALIEEEVRPTQHSQEQVLWQLEHTQTQLSMTQNFFSGSASSTPKATPSAEQFK